jgi:hypothetical protein
MPEFKSRSYANPRRLPGRNHYQEGPGFLFVAAQGGRPPVGIAQTGRAASIRRRRAALRRWAGGEPLGTICAEIGCSRASLRHRSSSLVIIAIVVALGNLMRDQALLVTYGMPPRGPYALDRLSHRHRHSSQGVPIGTAARAGSERKRTMDQTLDQPRGVRTVVLAHEHSLTMQRLAAWTLAITAVMGALFFLVGFPPAFDTFYEKMYFHAIGIGLAALAAYLVIDVFDLEAHEPPLDFPLRYRAFAAVLFGALGGLVYLDRDVFKALPDVGALLFVLAFLLAFDVAAALLVELLVLPRKVAGIYDSRSRRLLDYVGRLVPFTSADRAAILGWAPGTGWLSCRPPRSAWPW